jgi:hypothetical protein
MFRAPIGSWAAKSIGGEVKRRGKASIFPQSFPEFFGKTVDGHKTEVLAETLSLIGKLFEIYFVRLIGTPNQNSKNGAGFGRHRV